MLTNICLTLLSLTHGAVETPIVPKVNIDEIPLPGVKKTVTAAEKGPEAGLPAPPPAPVLQGGSETPAPSTPETSKSVPDVPAAKQPEAAAEVPAPVAAEASKSTDLDALDAQMKKIKDTLAKVKSKVNQMPDEIKGTIADAKSKLEEAKTTSDNKAPNLTSALLELANGSGESSSAMVRSSLRRALAKDVTLMLLKITGDHSKDHVEKLNSNSPDEISAILRNVMSRVLNKPDSKDDDGHKARKDDDGEESEHKSEDAPEESTSERHRPKADGDFNHGVWYGDNGWRSASLDKKKKENEEAENEKAETASNEEGGEEEESFDQWLRRQAAEAKKEAAKHSKPDAMTQQKPKAELKKPEPEPKVQAKDDPKPISANVQFHNFIEALKADRLADNIHMFHLPIPVLSLGSSPNCDEVGCDGNIEVPQEKAEDVTEGLASEHRKKAEQQKLREAGKREAQKLSDKKKQTEKPIEKASDEKISDEKGETSKTAPEAKSDETKEKAEDAGFTEVSPFGAASSDFLKSVQLQTSGLGSKMNGIIQRMNAKLRALSKNYRSNMN